jgi:hypothetical protein
LSQILKISLPDYAHVNKVSKKKRKPPPVESCWQKKRNP